MNLYQSGATTKVFCEIVDIGEGQAERGNIPLQHTLAFERQGRRNHWPPAPVFNCLQKTVGGTETRSKRGHQNIGIHD